MSEIMKKASDTLFQTIGQNKIMAFATRNGNGVASRTVNIYTFRGNFYLVTENDSNKFAQINENGAVALSVDAIQITGHAVPLEHPCSESNKEIADFIEAQLSQQFSSYAARPEMRLIRIKPECASLILLETGEGYAMNFSENTAVELRHEM